MPKYVSNRDFTLRSRTGWGGVFKKGVPKNVPPGVEPEAVNAGCVLEEENKPKPKPRGRAKKVEDTDDNGEGTDT